MLRPTRIQPRLSTASFVSADLTGNVVPPSFQMEEQLRFFRPEIPCLAAVERQSKDDAPTIIMRSMGTVEAPDIRTVSTRCPLNPNTSDLEGCRWLIGSSVFARIPNPCVIQICLDFGKLL